MKKLFADKIHAGELYKQLIELSKFGAKPGETYGSRAAGSTGDLESAEWMAKHFEKAGLKVHKEPFRSIVFHERKSHLEVGRQDFPARAFFYSNTTAQEGLEAEVVQLNYGETGDYEGIDVKGKIVVIKRDDKEIKENFWDEMLIALENQVAGLIMVDYSDNIFIPTFETGYFDPDKRLRTYDEDIFPAMVIGKSAGETLSDLINSGVKIVKMFIDAYFGPGEPVNVHGVWEGSDPALKNETILIYGHRDTVGNPGSADNGTGQVCLLALARALKDEKMKRTVEFISLDHEEQLACLGSKFYIEQHSDELQNIKAAFELDMPLGTGMMVITGGDFRETQIHYPPELVDYSVRSADELGYFMDKGWAGLGTPDSGRMLKAGIPTVWFWAHMVEDFMHTGEDVPEKIDVNSMKPFTEVMASMIYELANCEDISKTVKIHK